MPRAVRKRFHVYNFDNAEQAETAVKPQKAFMFLLSSLGLTKELG